VNDNGVFDDSNEGVVKEGEEITLEAVVSETAGVDLQQSETEEETDDTAASNNDNKPEKKTSNSSGSNTAENGSGRSGAVLGAATVRVKLSQVILGVRQRLEQEIASAPKVLRENGNLQYLRKKDFNLLVGPLNDLLARARMHEVAVKEKKTKLAANLLDKMKGDYGDFANKVDRLIAEGKLNKQTENVLVTLKQRLAKAGLR